jgi:hypothetical protein
MTLLVPIDPERFDELERVIERGLGTFVEVGRALLEIQRRRLYRAAGYETFAEYVEKRWDLSSAHAYRQIEASKVVDILSPIGEMPLPANEAQARELAPLVDDPDAVRAVWAETVQDGDGRITARLVREHVTARRPSAHTRKPMAARGLVVSAMTICPACGHQWLRVAGHDED